ncbi:conserved hypothetical protein, PP_1857 family [Pseudomonas sp. URIL14HWK12:I9]|nr:putative repeat protein (TIGR03837 family) [Pseudomonas sp. URIL14HWK12:I12]PVZ21337.1 putative repeat protein (TIGR03837 family) [Pseudomonas sp. URIL14HWK12:I10]PVZ30190.1 putative repeat protein (TIGR03837 family) [Pseudomonas sp. URIL14HWK12:I11]SNZ18726.1 conserved hypothetical protein, PP_1857 family [Pseudomonas sp. URIL14HWK12:I9]
MSRPSWDIFCKVVDNFGDIGVTWRLARQLVAEHGLQVRLWVDHLPSFVRLCPQAMANAPQQWHEGVQIRQWPEPWQPAQVAPVVIEAFGCKLPEAYVQAMAAQAQLSLWLNLDYLSAEPWVGGCHGLPSFSATGYRKFFFFPGFRPDTGGLLREQGLLARRDAFDEAARERFLRSLSVIRRPGALLVSLFAYENPSLPSWLGAMAAGPLPIQLLVPEGKALGDVNHWLGQPLAVGEQAERGRLHIQVLPFVPQQDYDRLLWACDFNAVRGEDSFVRAQWAGRPMLWHIYRQDEDVHLDKLEAFLELYSQCGLPVPAQAALLGLWRAWNRSLDMAAPWQQWLAHRETLVEHARQWCAEQAARLDLATALVKFHRNWL